MDIDEEKLQEKNLKTSRNRYVRKGKRIRWSGLVGLMVVLMVVVAIAALFACEKSDDEKWVEKAISSHP